MYDEFHSHLKEPMCKLVCVLAETEQGHNNRVLISSKSEKGWEWIYPNKDDLHLAIH